ncbi:MAG: glycosyltransferase, partial [Chloroflexota bacterium]|nr:glycosyltransferase [Chloroflexota bacterium]
MKGSTGMVADGAMTPAARTRIPRVSIIVPAHDAADTLPMLLARVAAQSLPREDFELIVVDDCSTDDTAGVVESSGFA